MTVLVRGLLAVGAVGSVALAPTAASLISLLANPSSLELECGSRGTGAPGEVVVRLLDQAAPPHGHLIVKAKLLEPDEQASAGEGAIRIESRVGGVPFMCESITAGHVAVHGTAARLTGATLRIVAMKPVPVELQDSRGRVLAAGVANPTSSAATKISW